MPLIRRWISIPTLRMLGSAHAMIGHAGLRGGKCLAHCDWRCRVLLSMKKQGWRALYLARTRLIQVIQANPCASLDQFLRPLRDERREVVLADKRLERLSPVQHR